MALRTKTDNINELEGQITQLTTSLEAAKADAEAKNAIVSGLEESKAALETQLKEAQDSLSNLQSEQTDAIARLAAVQEEVAFDCVPEIRLLFV